MKCFAHQMQPGSIRAQRQFRVAWRTLLGGWERQLGAGGPVAMAREHGNGLGSSVRCFWIIFFNLSVPNPNFRWKTCINVLTVLRLHLCREDKIVPPADPSPSIQSKPRFWGCCRNIYSLPWALFSPCTPPSGSF